MPEEKNCWFQLANIPQKELTPFALQAISILPQNQVWRPPNKIRGKVIGLAKHDNKLLVFEVHDDQGNLKGWCDIATFFCRLRTHAICLLQFLSYSSGERYPKKEWALCLL